MPTFQAACSPYELGRVEQLMTLAEAFDRAGAGDPSLFVKRVRQERVETPLPASVRVLTIHAAKGLEFESVILIDLDVDMMTRGEQGLKLQEDEEGHFFIQEGEGTMSLQGRAALSASLQEEQWAEMLSLLYVGMTRAASYLDLLLLEKPSRKKTMAQWLRLSGLEQHEVSGVALHQLKKKISPRVRKTPPYRPSREQYQKLSQRHPSEEQEGGLVSLGQLLRGGAARHRGILLHAQLARVAWEDRACDLGLELTEEQAEIFKKEHFLERWRSWGVTQLELWRERRFAVPHSAKGELLVGVFDRVVIGKNPLGTPLVAEIIDFKTGHRDRSTEHERLYQPQLNAYRRALQQMLPTLEEITTRLLFI